MEDEKIVELYWERSEAAIAQTQSKYGKYCHYIAYNILYSDEDAEECVNDTYIKAWDTMPPKKPQRLSTYLGKLTRNIALDRYDYYNADKRHSNTALVLQEVGEVLTAPENAETFSDTQALSDAINSFVDALPRETRIIFVRRYWYMSPIKDISSDYGIPEGTVKSILSRTRKKFKAHLLKEGIYV